MNDKDREAFEGWWARPSSELAGHKATALNAWQAALEYARKEQQELLEKCEEALNTCWTTGGGLDQFYDKNKVKQTLAELHEAGIGRKL